LQNKRPANELLENEVMTSETQVATQDLSPHHSFIPPFLPARFLGVMRACYPAERLLHHRKSYKTQSLPTSINLPDYYYYIDYDSFFFSSHSRLVST